MSFLWNLYLGKQLRLFNNMRRSEEREANWENPAESLSRSPSSYDV